MFILTYRNIESCYLTDRLKNNEYIYKFKGQVRFDSDNCFISPIN